MLGKIRGELVSASSAVTAVFANPGLRSLELSWGALSVATWSYAIALSVYAYEIGGVAAVGLIALIRLAPGALVSPLSGLVSDKQSRRLVLLVCTALVALILAASAAVGLLDGPAAVVYVLAGLFTVASTPFIPAESALTPQLARSPQELAAANLVFNLIDNGGFLVGSLITGLALALGPPGIAFALATVAGAASFLVALGLPRDERPEYAKGIKAGELVGETLSGFRLIAVDPGLRLPSAMTALLALVEGAADVLVVITALDLLGLSQSSVGYMNAAWGIGGLIGGAGLAVLLNRGHLIRSALAGSVILAAGLGLPALFPVVVAAYVGFLIVGSGHTFVDVVSNTLLQRLGDDESLGRIRGSLESLRLGAMALGSILVPAVVSFAGIRGTLAIAAVLLPLYLLVRSGRLRGLELGAPLEERHYELLHTSPIFAPLPIATLERLCHEVTERRVVTSEVVITEGEAGDLFFLIESGVVEVSREGRPEGTQGPGEGFGEIALLHDVPRMATITARTECTLLVLSREDFLEAVTGHTRSNETAHSVAAGHLDGGFPGR